MASMSFLVNDASTSPGTPTVRVTITENADGTLTFNVTQEGGIIGDLRGLFFDLNDESVRSTLSVSGANTTEFKTGDDSVKDLGDGANMNGLLGSDKGYDAGIEIGSSGIGKDDIRSYSFTLDSSARDLTLADFSNVDFGVRLTSVGVIGGSRADSSKIMETTFTALDAQNDAACTDENASASGNVLANDDANDTASGTLSVASWSGGALGEAVALDKAAGATLQLNGDGSYVLDASSADALSEGEHLEFTFTYNVNQNVDAGDSASDQATFTVCIDGKNDGPVAGDDDAGCIAEDGAIANASVTGNDTDVDRLDTHTWSLVADSFNGLGNLSFNADGTWSYDAGGAYDSLNDGEHVDLSFQYVMDDGNTDGTDLATVSLCIQGVSDVIDPPPPPPPPPPAEVSTLGLSHGYWTTHDGSGPQANDWNVATNTSFESIFGDHGSWDIESPYDTNGAPYTKGDVVSDITFAQALALGGGGQNALAREAVGAYLNAIDEDNVDNGGAIYDFAYSAAEVVLLVNGALTYGGPVVDNVTNVLLASHD